MAPAVNNDQNGSKPDPGTMGSLKVWTDLTGRAKRDLILAGNGPKWPERAKVDRKTDVMGHFWPLFGA